MRVLKISIALQSAKLCILYNRAWPKQVWLISHQHSYSACDDDQTLLIFINPSGTQCKKACVKVMGTRQLGLSLTIWTPICLSASAQRLARFAPFKRVSYKYLPVVFLTIAWPVFFVSSLFFTLGSPVKRAIRSSSRSANWSKNLRRAWGYNGG